MSLIQVKGDLSVDTSNVYVDGKKADLSVCHVDADEYHQLVSNDSCISNVIYVVEDDKICAYGSRITDVADPISAQDAVTLNYMTKCISSLNNKTYITSADVADIVKQQMRNVLSSIKI